MDGDFSYGNFEYITPRAGAHKSAINSTVPKASKEAGKPGSMLHAVQLRAKNPGPDQYHKNNLDQSFCAKTAGGSFAKLTKVIDNPAKKPAVRQYDIADALPAKVKGGSISKTDRTCYFIETAKVKGKNIPSPDKYDSIAPSPRIQSLKWDRAKTESRNPESMKVKPIGPGHYSPNYAPAEKHVPDYTTPKEPSRSFFEQLLKQKKNVPAPGTHSLQLTGVEDRSGRSRHLTRLLGDRIVTPR